MYRYYEEGETMANSRKKKLALNTIFSFLLQVARIISGFILPRLILDAFGSNVNGLVNSITQFLGVITLLDLGVGAVVQSALYKPLAENDINLISQIYVSAKKFFNRLALILLGYIIILCVVYPVFINHNFGYMYDVSLIVAISISSFAQYYFGIVNSLLLSADQKGYIECVAHIVTIVLNTAACAVLIRLGGSIQIVKLTTSLTFLCRPLFLNWYVRKHYQINRKITYTEEPIKQKWNGMAQHFAFYVLDGTDNIVLTIFSSLANVSIYSVYNTVIMGIKNALLSMGNGFRPLMGELYAKKEINNLKELFSWVEWLLHTEVTLVFGCTGILIVSFIQVYTNGITDADYYQPLFAALITIANAVHCFRLPYHILILAAGKYKQTQCNYIIAMLLNIFISIITVKIWGLIGVSIGTLVAMLYQTIWMAWYCSQNIIQWEFRNFLKQIFVDIFTIITAAIITYRIPLLSVSYISWFIQAIKVFICWGFIIIIINSLFYMDKMKILFQKISGRTYGKSM